MNNLCPNYEKCPIYNEVLKDKDNVSAAYKNQYCKAGESAYITCKRFMAKAKFGQCPPNLLPNSQLTLEEIGKKYFNIG